MNHRTYAPLPTTTTPDRTPPRTGRPAQEPQRGEGPSLWDDYARSLLPPFVRDLPDEMLLAAYGLPPGLLSRPPAEYEDYEDESDEPDFEPEPAPEEKVLGPAGITKAPPLPPGPGPGPPRPPKGIKPKSRRPRVGENPAWLKWLEELLRGGDPWKRMRDLFGDGRRTVAANPEEIVLEEEERNGQGPPDSSGGNGHPAGDDGGQTAAFIDKRKTRRDKTKHGYTVFDEFNTPVFGSRGSHPVIDCPPPMKGDPNYDAYHRRGISPEAIAEIKQDLSERLNSAIGKLAAKADQIFEPVAALIAVNQALPVLQRRSDKLANVPGIPLTDVRTGGSNPGALPMTAANQEWAQAQTDLSLAEETKHQLRNIESNARTRVAQRLKEESGLLGLGILLPFIDMLDEPPAKISEIRRHICQYQLQIAFAEQLVKLAEQAERAILMYENEETARDEDHFVRFVGKILDTDLFANQVGHAAVTERLSRGFNYENAPQLRGPATDERLRELWGSLDKREKEYFRDQETLEDVEDELQKTRKWASAAFTVAEIAAYEAVGLGAAAILSRGKRAAQLASAADDGLALSGLGTPPTGSKSRALKAAFLREARSAEFRHAAEAYVRRYGREPINWSEFNGWLRQSEFRDYASIGEAARGLGWASPKGEAGLFGMPKPLRAFREPIRHELLHGIQFQHLGVNPRLPFGPRMALEAATHHHASPKLFYGSLGSLLSGTVYATANAKKKE